jgi:aminodeoxyfutalosine deaminase
MGDYLASIQQGFAEARRFGTTTILNLTAYPELIARVKAPIRTWWFTELIDVREPDRTNELIGVAVNSLRSALECSDMSALSRRRRRPAVQRNHWGLAPHALYTASASLFRGCEQVAQQENVLLTTHLAESREEMSMFRDGGGPLFDFLKEIGRDMSDCGRAATPLAAFGFAHGDHALYRWILVHLNELSETDLDWLATQTQGPSRGATAKFAIVHCPRSHKYFGHSPFGFQDLRKLGFCICLGTDSLASNDDLSLFAEMRQFQRIFPGVSPEEILSLVTKNAARALDQKSLLGELKPGAFADLIAVPVEANRNIFEQIIAFSQDVSWSMINGVLMQDAP